MLLSKPSNQVLIALALTALCLVPKASAKDDWKELLKLLPESTNAVMAVDLDSMFSSQLAVENNWRKSQQAKLDHQFSMLPTNASRFVLATELDLQHMEPEWEFAAIKLEQPIAIEQVRDAVSGETDSLAGMQSVRTSRGSFLVPFSDNRVGLIRIAPTSMGRSASALWASSCSTSLLAVPRQRGLAGFTAIATGSCNSS